MVDLSKNTKIIISVIGAVGMIFMAAVFFEDRFENESDAAETKTEVADLQQVSQEQIDTLESVQQSLKSMERNYDLRALESYRNEKYLMKKQLDANPSNELLEERIERLGDKIQKLENKLY